MKSGSISTTTVMVLKKLEKGTKTGMAVSDRYGDRLSRDMCIIENFGVQGRSKEDKFEERRKISHNLLKTRLKPKTEDFYNDQKIPIQHVLRNLSNSIFPLDLSNFEGFFFQFYGFFLVNFFNSMVFFSCMGLFFQHIFSQTRNCNILYIDF